MEQTQQGPIRLSDEQTRGILSRLKEKTLEELTVMNSTPITGFKSTSYTATSSDGRTRTFLEQQEREGQEREGTTTSSGFQLRYTVGIQGFELEAKRILDPTLDPYNAAQQQLYTLAQETYLELEKRQGLKQEQIINDRIKAVIEGI